MKLGKLSLGIAAAALVAAPVFAQANLMPAIAPLSGEETGQSGDEVLIGVIIASATIGGIIIAAGDGEDEPVSP